MYYYGKYRTCVADWFTNRIIIERLIRATYIVARGFYARVASIPADLVEVEKGIGWCNAKERLIWVNPLGPYLMSNFGIDHGMDQKSITETNRLIIRGVLGLDGGRNPLDINALEEITGLSLENGGIHYDYAGRLVENQIRIREWMRDRLGLTILDEWKFTQYALFHERAHERWTDMPEERVLQLLHTIWNILEDERIERLLTKHWVRASWFVREGNKIACRMLMDQWKKTVGGDHPVQSIINFMVMSRNGFRAGEFKDYEDAKQVFTEPEIVEVMDECWPIVLRAWNECENAEQVMDCAREILEILQRNFASETTQCMVGIPIPGATDDLEGEGSGSGKSEEGDGEGDGEGGGSGSSGDEEKQKDADGADQESPGLGDSDVDPNSGKGSNMDKMPEPYMPVISAPGGRQPGSGSEPDTAVVPADYHQILHEMKKGITRMRRAFEIPEPTDMTRREFSGRTGKLSARAFRKTLGEKPFEFTEDAETPTKFYLEVLVDWSGSMADIYGASLSGDEEKPIEFARKVCVQIAEALDGHKRIDYSIWLMPDDILVTKKPAGEDGLARCAGIMANAGTSYNQTVKASFDRCEKQRRRGYHAAILVVADGEITHYDRDATQETRKKGERQGTLIKVIYMAEKGSDMLSEAFGEDNVIICPKANELVNHVEAISISLGRRKLRRVYV